MSPAFTSDLDDVENVTLLCTSDFHNGEQAMAAAAQSNSFIIDCGATRNFLGPSQVYQLRQNLSRARQGRRRMYLRCYRMRRHTAYIPKGKWSQTNTGHPREQVLLNVPAWRSPSSPSHRGF
ncbi:hypothetical protein Hypma_009971 [Hypsizygus marmoreus]|uniref:Uncharacterized protein n=1 Tax=Hypsizygus marmoreus TaxID=39966 RepID=A0A369JQ96_HYPMA|nr:hypothetical protein Hypma_009971 [Hypsizygus marmoreus]